MTCSTSRVHGGKKTANKTSASVPKYVNCVTSQLE